MKDYSSKIRCGIILALSIVSVLCFAFLPVLTIRPDDFGMKEVKNVEINCTIWDIRKDFSSFEKKITDKISVKEIQNLEKDYGSFVDFIPGYSQEDLHKAVQIITWWLKFPTLFTIAVVMAFAGLILSCGFAIAGLVGVRNKCLNTIWCTVGAMLYILSGVILCIWGVKAVHDLAILLDNEVVQKVFDLKSLLGDTVKMTQRSIGMLIRCGGMGIFIPWGSSVAVAVLGIINAVKKNTSQPQLMKIEKRAVCTGELQVVKGEYEGCEIKLQVGESVCIGRDPMVSQLVLSDRNAPPCHCKITYCSVSDNYNGESRYYAVTNLAPEGSVRVAYPKSPAKGNFLIPFRKTYKVESGGEVSLEPGENKIILM